MFPEHNTFSPSNEGVLIRRLVNYLEAHEPMLHDKVSHTISTMPDAFLYYSVVLDWYYLKEADFEIIRENIDEHLTDIIKFLHITDEDYEVVLIPGQSYIPDFFETHLHINNTRYTSDTEPLVYCDVNPELLITEDYGEQVQRPSVIEGIE